MHALTVFNEIIAESKAPKPIIYAGELNWFENVVELPGDSVEEGVAVYEYFREQPQPFAEILKRTADDLYLDILPIVCYLKSTLSYDFVVFLGSLN